jgi:hypothetical protein
VRGEAGAKERISGSERGDERKRRKMAGGGGRLIEEKMEQREKVRKSNVIIIGIGEIRGNIERGVEEWKGE